MRFWNKVSAILSELPESNKKFIENVWMSLSYIAGQLNFEVQNAVGSTSPDYIPIYRIKYWKKYTDPWDVESDAYSIPKLQEYVFLEDHITYIENEDYFIIDNKIEWLSLGPVDGDMEMAGVDNWAQIGIPATFEKDASEQYSGTQCLKVDGDVLDGVRSSDIMVYSGDWIRYLAMIKSSVGFIVTLRNKDNNDVIDQIVMNTSQSEYAENGNIVQIPDGCECVVIDITLKTSGIIYIDDLNCTRYPRNSYVFAEQVLCYNPYLNTKHGYELKFTGINTIGYGPEHAHNIIRVLNYCYRSSDTYFSVKAGITAVLGLPFAYVAGVVAKKETSIPYHIVTILDSENVEHEIKIDSSLCSLLDLINVGDNVKQFEPLIPNSIKIKEFGGHQFVPLIETGYPVDGDMEMVGVDNWESINGAGLSKDTDNEYSGSQCLKIETAIIGSGCKPKDNTSVQSGLEYMYDFYIKTDGDAVVLAEVVDIDHSDVIISEWFGDTEYENGRLRFAVPDGCTEVNIKFTTLKQGDYFMDNLRLTLVDEIKYYRINKLSDSVKSFFTISAEGRAGNEAMTFRTAGYIYGKNGNNVKVAISPSGEDQELSSSISGSGTDGDPYIYTVVTGILASQSSNSAIREFVNLDLNAIGIVACESSDNDIADPGFELVEAALSGGANAIIGAFEDTPFVSGDFIAVCNFNYGTREDAQIVAIADGDAPYDKYFEIDRDLTEFYESTIVGVSTSVGENFLTDESQSFVINEHVGDKLIDSDANEYKIISNTTDTLAISGTPAAGQYHIIKDHIMMIYGQINSGYVTKAKVYSRYKGLCDQVNIDRFTDRINDKGHDLIFVDVS